MTEAAPPRRVPPGDGHPSLDRSDNAGGPPPAEAVRDLRDLIAWLRQRVRGEHTVRASVLTVEPVGAGSYLLLLGEADPGGSSEPPRLKVRLEAADLAACKGVIGDDLDPASLVNRILELRLSTSMRQRYGRGAGVQARVTAVLSIGAVPLVGEIERERTLQLLRLGGRRFGSKTWTDPEDPRQIALIAAEFGDARRDVEHVLRPLEEIGLIHIHRIWVSFEGPGAEQALIAAFTRVAELDRDHGLSATLVCRGGGPVEGFRALNAYATASAAAAAELPNLITGLGHAGTPCTALDAIAARSEPTPTAAAMLVRQIVEATGIRAERALAAFDAALAEDLEAAARIALARATQAFDLSLRDLIDRAEQRLRQLDRAVEQSLFANLAAASGEAAMSEPDSDPVETVHVDEEDEDRTLEAGLALVTVADTGLVITRYEDLRSDMSLFLHFRDGTVFVRIVPICVAFH